MLLKVTLVMAMDSMVIENTFGLETAGDVVPQDYADAAGAVLESSALMGGRSTAIALYRVRVEDVVPGTSATGEYILPVPLAGDDATNAAPALCALVAQWRGPAKGKAGRGRMFLTGWPASTAVGSFWTSDAQDPASAGVSVIFDTYGPAGSGELCIINRYAAGVKLDPPVATPITSFGIDNIIRRIGRREQRVGI